MIATLAIIAGGVISGFLYAVWCDVREAQNQRNEENGDER